MLSLKTIYLFSYNLFQFSGHTWILANIIARFLMFGQDAVADTFYSVGFVMSLCQLLSILELFHIADGIERARLLPRFLQVLERNVLLMMVIKLEAVQTKAVVCVQFLMWNILALLRYPHELLCVVASAPLSMLWTRYTLWIPLYVLSVASEGVLIHEAVTLSLCPLSDRVSSPAGPCFLSVVYLLPLTCGASVTMYQMLKERKQQLDKWSRKQKRQ